MDNLKSNINWHNFSNTIKLLGQDLGFTQIGITDTNLAHAEIKLNNWISANYHGSMNYMVKHGTKRSRPNELMPGTKSIIVVTLNYLPKINIESQQILNNSNLGYISRYALGRDYHKVINKKLKKLK